ncbi:MAG: hypothetical protein LBU51_04015 [Bacteroidales bacterium]|jgi:hypothetical protein|nr:hypothetical protein [Bacteroidales bacterium]
MSEYISIKEFATRAGVTTQAIYQRIDKDLQSYFKIVGNKKCLNISALEMFSLKQDDKQPQDNLQTVDNSLVSTLQETLKVLTAQLEVKDIQISELNERLKEAQELNRNNQFLLGSEQIRTNPALLTGIDPPAQDENPPIKKKRFWNLFKK